MKRKMTKKELRAIADYKIGYCSAYYLLYGIEPFGYTAGVYGWDSDAYSLYIDGIGHITISTGYRPVGADSIDYDILNKYEQLAQNVALSNKDYKVKCDEIAILRNQLFNEIA